MELLSLLLIYLFSLLISFIYLTVTVKMMRKKKILSFYILQIPLDFAVLLVTAPPLQHYSNIEKRKRVGDRGGKKDCFSKISVHFAGPHGWRTDISNFTNDLAYVGILKPLPWVTVSKGVIIYNFSRIENIKFYISFLLRIVQRKANAILP